MRPPQHCANALGDVARLLEVTRRKNLGIAEEHIIGLARDLTTAEKFMLPAGGRLLHGDDQQIRAWMPSFPRLPFPVVALEFDTDDIPAEAPGQIDAMVVVAHQPVDPEAIGITVCSIIRWRNRPGERPTWVPADEVVYDPQSGEYLGFGGAITKPKTGNLQDHPAADAITRAAVAAITEFLAALACSNVLVETAPRTEKRHWMQTRRERALPHFTYKVLTIDTPSTRSAASGEDHHGGTHASPRLHIRRGHIRRYPSGKLAWVNAHMVGSAEAGTIAKDYRVRARAQETTR